MTSLPQAPPTSPTAGTLELRDYFRVLRRHKWIIISTIVVCVAVATGIAVTRTPVYEASTSVLLQERLVDQLFVPSGTKNTVDDRKRANEIQVMSSPSVRARVKEELGKEPEQVTFSTEEGNDVIYITAKGQKPGLTAATANTFADTYIVVRTELTTNDLDQAAVELQKRIDNNNQKISALDQSLTENPPATANPNSRVYVPTDPRLTERNQLASEVTSYANQLEKMKIGISVAQQSGAQILSRARIPKEPVNGSPLNNALAGLAIGVVLGIALAFLREYSDDSVKSKDDLEGATGLTVVGIIPHLPDWKKRDDASLISIQAPRSPSAEAYRNVRTSVEFLSLDQPMGSIQVTSSLASEGKTTTLSNLAVTFARAGQRVIILCCDLRRPRVHEFFGLSNRVGFTSVLLGDAPVGSAIQQADRDLPIGLVASGPLPPNPAELLASRRAVDVIEDLDQRCDLLLIDSPPVLPVTDALVISGLVDGVLMVASSGVSTKRGVRRATELLRQVEAPLIGAILNGAQAKHEYSYAYGDNRYYLDAEAATRVASEGRGGRRGRNKPATRAAR